MILEYGKCGRVRKFKMVACVENARDLMAVLQGKRKGQALTGRSGKTAEQSFKGPPRRSLGQSCGKLEQKARCLFSRVVAVPLNFKNAKYKYRRFIYLSRKLLQFIWHKENLKVF